MDGLSSSATDDRRALLHAIITVDRAKRLPWIAALAVLPLLAIQLLLIGSFGANAQPAELEDTPSAPRAEPVKRLRLMLLDLADLREPESRGGFEPPAGTYRHTFGSQRHTNEEALPPIINPEALEADVVMLRGLGEMRAARRLFPARDWRLLLSRGALGDRSTTVDDPRTARKPSSAVALWLQPGVRFGGGDPSLAPGLGAAMRVVSGLGTLWVLSPSMPCGQAQATGPGTLCKPLDDWIDTKLAIGDLVLVGGLLPPARRTLEEPVAPRQVVPPRSPPAGALPLAIRRDGALFQLTAADSSARCSGDGEVAPALHLRIARGNRTDLRLAGYLLPLEATPSPLGPASRPPAPPRAPACALLLDLELTH